MDNNFFIVGIITGFAFVLVLLILTYNRLVRLRNRVQNAWSDVDVQLKRPTISFRGSWRPSAAIWRTSGRRWKPSPTPALRP